MRPVCILAVSEALPTMVSCRLGVLRIRCVGATPTRFFYFRVLTVSVFGAGVSKAAPAPGDFCRSNLLWNKPVPFQCTSSHFGNVSFVCRPPKPEGHEPDTAGNAYRKKTHNTILDSSLNEILLILLLQEVHHPSHLFATFNRP